MALIQIIIASLTSFFAEIYGSLLGGGSILTQFVLQHIVHMGLKEAIALDNAAVIGSQIGLLYMLLRKQKLTKQHWYFMIFVVIGSIIGSQLLHIIPLEILQVFYAITLLFVLAKTYLQKEAKAVMKNQTTYLYAFGVILGVYNAMFSIGDWLIGLLGLTLLGYSYKKSLLYLAFSLVIGQLVNAGHYFSFGYIQIEFFIPMFFATLCSGLISGWFVNKYPLTWMKTLLRILGICLGLYLLIGLFI